MDKSFPNLTAKVQANTASLNPLDAGSHMQVLRQCGLECSLKGGVLCSWIRGEAFRRVENKNIHSFCKKSGVQDNEIADLADPN